MRKLVSMATSREIQMDGYSGSGLPTDPPSQAIFSENHSQWLFRASRERAFAPFTAAGQRGLCTPLPHIHSAVLCGQSIKHLSPNVNDNLSCSPNRFMMTQSFHAILLNQA